jgi:hypothetical protein
MGSSARSTRPNRRADVLEEASIGSATREHDAHATRRQREAAPRGAVSIEGRPPPRSAALVSRRSGVSSSLLPATNRVPQLGEFPRSVRDARSPEVSRRSDRSVLRSFGASVDRSDRNGCGLTIPSKWAVNRRSGQRVDGLAAAQADSAGRRTGSTSDRSEDCRTVSELEASRGR